MKCLPVICHLHFWQNDRDRLRATAVTRGWNGYRNKSAQKVDPGEENSPAAPAGIRTRDLSVTSPALYKPPTELTPSVLARTCLISGQLNINGDPLTLLPSLAGCVAC